MNKLKAVYGVPGRVGCAVPWYDEAGNPNFTCHADNERHHNAVVDDYVEIIAEDGVVQEARGAPFAILNSTPTGLPYLLITFGTLSRAFYKANKIHADKKSVIASREAGLQNVTVLIGKTPMDAYGWLRDYHNSTVFQSGATTSFAQVLTETPQFAANWEAASVIKGVAKGDVAERWKWVKGKTDKYSSNNVFESALAVTNRMLDKTRLNCMAEFSTMAGDYCDFRNRALSSNAVIMNVHSWAVALDPLYGSMDEEWRRIIFLEGCRFMMPMSRSHTVVVGRKIPWLFPKFCPAMLRWILTPMGSSVIFKAKVTTNGLKTKRQAAKKTGSATNATKDSQRFLNIFSK